MIFLTKSNKRKSFFTKKIPFKIITIIVLLAVCVIFILSPAVYAKSCLNAISLWAVKVLPSLFPFFIITRIIVSLMPMRDSKMDKLMNKIYHTGNMSSIIYFLSTLSGYPMGAKLICTAYENGQIDKTQAEKMLSLCSVSGPMFMVGSVGVGFLLSFKSGIIILISNIISSLINGLIYRGKPVEIKEINYVSKNNSNLLFDSVYDALISILMVGGFMVIAFLLIDVLKNLGIIGIISKSICGVFNMNNSQYIVSSVLCGGIEITRGIADLSSLTCSLMLKTIIASTLIAFGGVSILMQSISFLNRLHIKTSTMLKQKFTQGIICLIVSSIICLIFF